MKNNWIRTEDHKPDFGDAVLVWCAIYGFYIGYFQQIGDTCHGVWSDGKDSGVLPPKFWQPLPLPPLYFGEI